MSPAGNRRWKISIGDRPAGRTTRRIYRNIAGGLACCALLAGCEPHERAGEQVYEGLYVWGHEANMFQPCDNDKTFWVSAGSWVQEPLLDFYKTHTSQPYQAIYIEFRGIELNEEVDGFAGDHDGLIRISEVLDLSLRVPEACH
jgi:hypothetical protein